MRARWAALGLLVGCNGGASSVGPEPDGAVLTGAGGGSTSTATTSTSASSAGGHGGTGGAGGGTASISTSGAGGAGGVPSAGGAGGLAQAGGGGAGGAPVVSACDGAPDGFPCAEAGGHLCKAGACVPFIQVRCVTDAGDLYRACDGNVWPWSIDYVAKKDGPTWTWDNCTHADSFGYCTPGYECTVYPDIGASKQGHCQ